MKYILMGLLAACLVGCAQIGIDAVDRDALPSVRVMTFNILRDEWARSGYPSWSERKASAVTLLREHRPDVVGLQEETANQVAFLNRELPAYTYLAPHHKNGGGLLIRTDAWRVIDQGKIDIPGNRQASWALLELRQDGQQWAVYNVHFMHDSEPKRLVAAKRIADHIAHNTPRGIPVVVLGDLNARHEEKPLRYLYGDEGSPVKLANAFNAVHGDDDPRGTTHGFSGNRHVPRIDHILVNERVKVLSAEILYDKPVDVFPSDHYPVEAQLTVSR